MFVLAVIPARAGSKGLPRKNLRLLGGKPLIAWSISAARKSRLITRAIISTDDKAIARTARRFGGEVPFLRPRALARDDSNIILVLQHAVCWLKNQGISPDVVVLLQPTSPLRGHRDIDETVRLVVEKGADSAQTVALDEAHPLHRFTLSRGRLKPLFPKAEKYRNRQQAPKIYKPTGSVYAARTAVLMKNSSLAGRDHRGFVSKPEFSVDIDTLWDFRKAEWILEKR